MHIRPVMAIPLLLVGCAAQLDDDYTTARSEVSLTLSTTDAASVLALVNYPGTDLGMLDNDAGLDSRAAAAIVAHRAGPDLACPSADDDAFDDLAELDAMPYVGDVAFAKLIAYAAAHPAPADESVEGVLFRGWEAKAIVWGVNQANVTELDIGAGLDRRAAANLVAGAPFASVTAMGPVSYVGTSALEALRARALLWWAGMTSAPAPAQPIKVDGVAFDLRTTRVAVEIANAATHADLVAHGVWSTGASAIAGGRPYADLAQVGAVSGVGTATMRALHDYAASGTWRNPEECYGPNLQTRPDADMADFNRLLEIATTGDWPYAETIALQADLCVSMGDAGGRDSIFEHMVLTPQIHWGYGRGVYPEGEDFFRGAARFVNRMDTARVAILERVLDGRFVPATPEEQLLFDRLDELHAAITAGPRNDPNRFYETLLEIEASECSQDAAVLIDPVDNRIWVIHRNPRC